MKNRYISPVQISHLVRLTADLFNTLDKEVQAMHTSPQKAIQVNFVVDLLKELVGISYPVQKITERLPSMQQIAAADCICNFEGLDMGTKEGYTTMANLDSKHFDEALQKLNNAMNDYKPTKAGEF